MIAVGIETSATIGSVAVLRCGDLDREPRFDVGRPEARDGAPADLRAEGDGWSWRERSFAGELTHGRELVPALQGILAAEGIDDEAVDAIYVSLGPGSYTGLRVGVTTAKTLASLRGIRLIGVESLDVMARGAPDHDGPILPVLDARLRQVYWASYERRAGGTVRLHGLDVCAIDAFPAPPEGALLLGHGLDRLRAHGLPSERVVLGDAGHEPRACRVLEAGLEAHRHGASDDPMRLAPLYLRPSEPEMKRDAAPPAGVDR